MGVNYQIIWDAEALNTFKLIFYWYKINRSITAANKFRKSIKETISLIQNNPFIGAYDKFLMSEKPKYRSLPSYPHHRIIYFIEENAIYITAIRDNRMKTK